jgi:hypothetical protein
LVLPGYAADLSGNGPQVLVTPVDSAAGRQLPLTTPIDSQTGPVLPGFGIETRNWRDLIVTASGLPPAGGQPLDWTRVNPLGETVIDHVNLHGVDDLTKPIHGVFSGDPVLTTESAWAGPNASAILPVLQANGNLRYDIPIGRSIGWQGGFNGSGAPLFTVRIVTTPTGQVVTSFPK